MINKNQNEWVMGVDETLYNPGPRTLPIAWGMNRERVSPAVSGKIWDLAKSC